MDEWSESWMVGADSTQSATMSSTNLPTGFYWELKLHPRPRMNIFIHQFGISSRLSTKPEQQQILVPLPCDRADGAWRVPVIFLQMFVGVMDGWCVKNIRGPNKITTTRSVDKSTKTLKVREKRPTKTPSGYKIYARMNSDPELRVPDFGHAKVPPCARKKNINTRA